MMKTDKFEMWTVFTRNLKLRGGIILNEYNEIVQIVVKTMPPYNSDIV